ncbi:MAG: CoA transferase [Ramlibacter sp.]|jgi:formyl-CoA transferase|nr:CoA transferase [Ramlibacter sp.]
MTKKILEGVVVLDLTRFFSGPQATLLLAGLGAEVIKVDDPATGDPTAFAPPFAGPEGVSFRRQTDQDMGLAYLKRQRGKKSTTLNLKSARGREIFLQMVAHADVVVENFSAGVADRLGIGYGQLREANPKIIHCGISGYGATGPDRNMKAYDLMVQAAVGMMAITGTPESGPTKAGTPLSDAISGTFAALGIVSALYHRAGTGLGQSVDLSMADGLFSLLFDEPLDCYDRLGLAAQQGNRIMRFSPFNTYRTADGWVTIGCATDAEWNALLAAMGQPGHEAFARVSGRLADNAGVDRLVGEWTRTLASAQVQQALDEARVPCSPVRSIDDLMKWRQLRERDMVLPLVNPLLGRAVAASGPGFPIKFSGAPAAYDAPAPIPGAHTEEVLARLAAIAPDALAQLKREGIV